MHAGPQLYKTVEAAVYTTLVYANDTNSVPLGKVHACCQLVLRALHAWLGYYNDHQVLWLHLQMTI